MMTDDSAENPHFNRLVQAGFGALAGLAAWIFDILWDHVENERAIMTIAAFASAFFVSLLVSIGPLTIRRAALAGLAVSVIPALLLLWASFRFEEVDNLLETADPMLAFIILSSVPLPFLIAGLSDNSRWNDYAALFDHAWNIVVRYAVAWVFVGVFWGVVMLSDQLLKIVGLEIIEDFLRIEAVPYLLTGGALGLALAVVYELRAYVSPYLVLRLLRLFLPVVLIVVAIFVVAVPIQGISGLFGNLSAAGILMSMVIGAVTLITIAIDQKDGLAVAPGFMRKVARALAVLLPILAALAAYAIWARINQYGWSPERIAAVVIAVFVLAYALIYALAIVRNANWMGGIRKANITMALAMVGVAALWLTPLLNPQRISTASQMARFQDGQIAASDLDLWEIGREWGKPGKAALAVLAAYGGPDADALEERLEALDGSSNEWNFKNDPGNQSTREQQDIAALKETLPIRPDGHSLPDGVDVSDKAASILQGCKQQTPAGNPACIGLFADFLPKTEGQEIFVVWARRDGKYVEGIIWVQDADGEWSNVGGPEIVGSGYFGRHESDIIDDLLTGNFTTQPAPFNTLKFSDVEIFVRPR
ncbi:MAG: DUF4153 domain-containing protein [Marinosulfonomonas sp.]|nr:DUF4153 domain-containing protein [Marinosulfonomonas sp.]